jgi:LAO/AO transport system kinase
MMDHSLLEKKIKEKDIVALSKAITMNESSIIEDNIVIDRIIANNTHALDQSIVISISGIPGVGKSSFINVLGEFLHRKNLSIAVFSIDPSSELSQGSILGDKTRMTELSRLDHVFIRPSPSSNRLGGVGINTHNNIELAKIAGYDIILIESVGVGQSETVVKQLSDIFLLLTMPSSGDELQGIKKGIMEMADFFIIHKADGALKIAAEQSQKDIEAALHMTRTEDLENRIFRFSSVEKIGLETIWDALKNYAAALKKENKLIPRRRQQRAYWAEESYKNIILSHFIAKHKLEFDQLNAKILNGSYVKLDEILALVTND